MASHKILSTQREAPPSKKPWTQLFLPQSPYLLPDRSGRQITHFGHQLAEWFTPHQRHQLGKSRGDQRQHGLRGRAVNILSRGIVPENTPFAITSPDAIYTYTTFRGCPAASLTQPAAQQFRPLPTLGKGYWLRAFMRASAPAFAQGTRDTETGTRPLRGQLNHRALVPGTPGSPLP